MIELAAVGAFTMALVEIGKRRFPNVFSSDVNVLWTVMLYAMLNALNAFYYGGDVKVAISSGIVEGLALAGLYRGVAGLAKRNSVDLTEQVVPISFGAVRDDAGDEDGKAPIGFGK